MRPPTHQNFLLLFAMLGAVAFSSVAAYAESADVAAIPEGGSGAAQENEAQIATALSVTRASVEQLLTGLRGNAPEDTYEHADYNAKVVKLQARIQEATNHFEAVLRDDILRRLSSYMAFYNGKLNTLQLSEAEKEIDRPVLHAQLGRELEALSQQYQAEIRKLYASGGIDLFDENTVKDYQETRDVSWRELYRNILPVLTEGCASQTCIAMTAADQVLLYTLVLTRFDKNLSFKLVDGTSIELAGEPDVSRVIKRDIDLIGDASPYQTELSQLAFGVSEKELPEGLPKAQAMFRDFLTKAQANPASAKEEASGSPDSKGTSADNKSVDDRTFMLSERARVCAGPVKDAEAYAISYIQSAPRDSEGDLKFAGVKLVSDISNLLNRGIWDSRENGCFWHQLDALKTKLLSVSALPWVRAAVLNIQWENLRVQTLAEKPWYLQ